LDNLLTLAIEAHGGLNAWNEFEKLHANVSIGGVLWDAKGIPGVFQSIRVDLTLGDQQVTMCPADSEQRILFTPNQISLESGGRILDSRTDPRSALLQQAANSKWDKLDAAYFAGYALWGYLTTPFLYTYPGFETREVEPWLESGERWRVLQVTFPEGYAAHTRTQYVYFGEDGLVRRHLYTVDILGGASGTNYALDYRSVDGIKVATRRQIVGYNQDRQKLAQPILVSIDLSEVQFE
jgi:hypothetical protein